MITIPPAKAASPPLCYLAWTLPNQEVFSPFGANRSASRSVPYHAGVDVCMPVGTPVPIISGALSAADATAGNTIKCHVIPWQGTNSPIHNNPGGFGLYTRYDCGNGVEVMMAHVDSYNGQLPGIISGQTGNACGGASGPHVHLEVFIDQQVVDPQCVFGLTKGPYHGKPQGSGNARTAQCNGALANGPLNLCDPSIRQALKNDGRSRVPITRYPPKASYSPETYPGKYGTHNCTATPKDVEGKPMCNVDHSQVPPSPDPNSPGYTGDPNVNTDEGSFNEGTGNVDEGTEIVWGPGGVTGDAGGDVTYGSGGPEAILPPVDSYNGEDTNSCAVDTWVAMTNQAVLEARREDVMNKRFIAKADSVIEYGCLAMYLKKSENEVAAIFSETDRWVNNTVDLYGDTHTMNKTLGTMSMDSALVNVVWAAQMAYKQNFMHPLLGGLEGYGMQAEPEKCADMQKVWDAAKCQNFPAGDEVFLTFKDLIDNDPRKFPQSMVCTNTGINQGMIDAAKNKATRYDVVEPKLDYLSATEECKQPIATGITIYRNKEVSSSTVSQIVKYPDAICPNAGCVYDNGTLSEKMGRCVRK